MTRIGRDSNTIMFSNDNIEVLEKAQEQFNIVLEDLPKDQVSEKYGGTTPSLQILSTSSMWRTWGGQPEGQLEPQQFDWVDNKDDEDLAAVAALDQGIPQQEPLTLSLPGPSVQVKARSNMWEPHPPAIITAESIAS